MKKTWKISATLKKGIFGNSWNFKEKNYASFKHYCTHAFLWEKIGKTNGSSPGTVYDYWLEEKKMIVVDFFRMHEWKSLASSWKIW